MRRTVKLLLICLGLVIAPPVDAGPLDETVFCGAPKRDLFGNIERSSAVIRAFKKLHPCPSTKLTYGACPDWVLDHPKPLACGYCDSVDNMQWLPYEVWKAKSLWERKIYGGRGVSPGCP